MVRALRVAVVVVLSFAVASAVVAGPGEPGAGIAPATDPNETAGKAVNDLMLGEYAAAEAAAASILKSAPGHAEALFVRGGVKLRRDKAYTEALADLQAAVKAGHDNTTVRWYCFECRVALKEFEGALADAEKAAEFAPKSALAKRRVGDALRLLGRHQEAIKAYTSALELDKGEYLARDGRARVYLDVGNFRSAMSDARALTVASPDHSGGWELLGRCYLTTRRYPEAEEPLSRAVKIDPTNLIAWDKLALCMMVQEKHEKALEPAIRAVELASSDARILTNLTVCLKELGKHDEAIRRVSAALLYDKPTAYRWQLRAECHAALKKYELAATDFAASLALDGDDLEVWAGYGEVLKKLNRFDQQLVALDRLISGLPPSAMFMSERVDVLIEMGRLDDARRAADSIPKELSGHWRVILVRADLLQKQRKFNELLPMCEELRTAMPEAPLGAIGRAACLAQMGKFDEALAALPESDETYAKSFCAHVHAAVHGVFGRWTQAEDLLRDAMPKDGDNLMLLAALGGLYLETGRGRDAYRATSRLVRDEPHELKHWLLHARVHATQGDAAEAESCLDRAIEVNPWSAEARNARGYFFMMQGDHASALPDIQRALELEPYNMLALLNLALIRAADPLEQTAALDLLKKVEKEVEHRRKNGDDPLGLRLFSARVCAARSLMMDPETAAKDRRSALDHLKAYRQSGRALGRDMRTELDLVALHGDPEFQALFEPAEKK